jgi:uncharacterized protein YhaN
VQTRTKAEWVDRYLPWNGGDYGGEIEYRISDKRYRLIRQLDWKQEAEQLVDLTEGKDITQEFAQDSRKDRLFLERQIQLSGESFRRIAVLTPGAAAEGKKEKKNNESRMIERLKRLLFQGEDLDVRQAFKWLEERLSEIGTPRASTKPLGAALVRKEQLERELEQLRAKYQQYVEEKQRHHYFLTQFCKAEEEQKELEQSFYTIKQKAEEQQRMEILQKELQHLAVERRALEEMIRQREELVEALDLLKKEKEVHQPPHLITYAEYYEVAEKLRHKNSLEQQLKEDAYRLEQLDRSIEEMKERFGRLLGMEETEALDALHRVKELKRIHERIGELKGHFENGEAGGRLADLEQDLSKLEELQKQEKEWHQAKMQVDVKLAEWTAQPSALSLFRPENAWLAGAAAGVALSLPLLWWNPLLALLPLAGAAAAGWYWWKRGEEERRLRRKRLEESESLKREARVLADRLSENERRQNTVLEKWKVKSLAELARMQADLLERERQKEALLQELRQLKELAAKSVEESRGWLERFLDDVPQFDAALWAELVESLISQFRRAKTELKHLQMERVLREKERKEREEQLFRVQDFLKRWEQRTGTTDLERIRHWLERSEMVRKLEMKIHEEENKLVELDRRREKEQWEEKLRECKEKMLENTKAVEEWSKKPVSRVDWKARLSEVELEMERVNHRWREQKENLDRLEGSLIKLEEWIEDLPKKETEYALVQDEIQKWQSERRALEVAREELEGAYRELKENLGPQLAPHASRWISRVTRGRYRELLLQSGGGLEIGVFVPETGELRPVEQLSQGTIDQMVFALRLSLVQFYSEHTGVHLPLFLDDCFVHFDEWRIRAALELVAEIAEHHQVVLFTCQSREREILDDMGLSYHSILLA